MSDRSEKINSGAKSVSDSANEIDELTKEINEDTAEHQRIIKIFENAMNNFASDRSLDTCLDALNASIQMAKIRHKLFQSYKHYSEILEMEIVRLTDRSGSSLHK
ncbi:MAG TPA: hypothetical protein VE572_01620 [Nitrososphaeraceae archaeon]|nr:hypothetical protein [Nitrososphaeraceae archaeon]